MLLATVSMLFTLSKASTSTENWSYSTPQTWGDLEGSFCGTQYQTQSPINIKTSETQSCSESGNQKLDWQRTDIATFNVIHTSDSHANIKIILETDDGEGSNDAFGKLKNNFKDVLNSEHGDYCLHSMHMHWKSEHTINEENSDLEMHFVHFSCEYDTFEQAMAATPTDKYVLAVVGVLYDEGAENKFIKEITDRIVNLKEPGKQIQLTTRANGIKVDDLLPTIQDNTQYYHYLGSLTTPMCNPVASWHILKDKKTVSASQLAALATILDGNDNLVTENYRPVQTNTNPVELCTPN
eukprot:419312_1